ncbi:DUF3500 domain-containing protein [Saccharothrix deserti]|uniref:DUF3500 domain-containing protein n=1 Tax=Saccharothrix deserti TaxID=2593674 RepID=UPI00131B766D|nr:DUF3500 domain-containing protein [Saccharothrix deserti]
MLHEIAEATRGFLNLLDDGQRAVAVRSMSDDGLRTRWSYLPGRRPGLVYGDLTRDQRKGVHRLLSCVLSPHAYAQAAAVMALEDVLDDREGGRRDRNQGDFWTVLLGEPGDEPWGWRVEGHHLSVSVVVADGRVSATPLFLGAQPARTTYRGHTVLQPLRLEEELARELLDRMGRTARGLAVVSDTAPPDILTGNSPRVGDLEPAGVTPAQLDRESRGLLVGLVRYYLDRLHSDLADEEFDALDLERLHFAWQGSAKRGEGHYYRIQGPELLIEYDNTAYNANHAHAVWRRRSGDFGEDLLAAHRASVRHE